MADTSGVDNLTSTSNGSSSLAGIQSAVDNLNAAKLEGTGIAGDIPTFPASGTALQDSGKTLPSGAIVGTTDTQTISNKTLTSPTISNPTTTGTDNGTQTLLNKIINAALNTISNITETMLSLSDVTTGNVSTSAHGFAPKAPNNTTNFLRGDGTWSPISGAYINGFGSWTSATADGSGHQVSSDGFLIGYATLSTTSAVNIYSDSSSTPSTLRQQLQTPNAAINAHMSFMMPVRKNDYYLIALNSNTCTVFFLSVS